MILSQYCVCYLAHAAHLVADPVGTTAVAIGPQPDIEQQLTDADQLELQIPDVLAALARVEAVDREGR